VNDAPPNSSESSISEESVDTASTESTVTGAVSDEAAPAPEALDPVSPPTPSSDDSAIELPPLAAATQDEQEEECIPLMDADEPELELDAHVGPEYEVVLQREPAVSPPPQTAPRRATCDEEGPEEEEGIHADELTRYFNVRGGVDAVRSSVLQVLNGHWLFLPYALLSASMARLFDLLHARAEGSMALTVVLGLAPVALTLFLWAGFVSCVKDGVFERGMGIERLIAGAAHQFFRFTGTILLVLPIAIGVVIGGNIVIGILWEDASLIGRIVTVVGSFALGLFTTTFLMVPPVIAAIEDQNPLRALTGGFAFIGRHLWDLVAMTLASFALWAVAILVLGYCYYMLAPMLFSLPRWASATLMHLAFGLIGAEMMGQVLAALMLLYLSNIREEERFERIRRRLPHVGARPALLIGVIVVLAALLPCLEYKQFGGGSVWVPVPSERGDLEPAEDETSPPDALEGLPYTPPSPR
jgi:hypothetical protein